MVTLKYNKRIYLTSFFILLVISLACLVGLNTQYQDQFIALTPYLIIVTAILILMNHREWNRYYVIFFIITCLAGYFVELAGVETGLLFGRFTYGDSLGYKLYGIPVITGLYWFLLVYSCGMVSNIFKLSTFIRAVIAALLMLIIDFSLEPVAISLDFWSWQGNTVPWHNYIGWFFVGLFLNLYFQQLKLKKNNRLALPYFIIQCIFFFVLSYTV